MTDQSPMVTIMVGDFIQNQFAAEVRVFGTKKDRYRCRTSLLGTRRGALASLSRVAAILAVILVPLILILVVLLPLLSILEGIKTDKKNH